MPHYCVKLSFGAEAGTVIVMADSSTVMPWEPWVAVVTELAALLRSSEGPEACCLTRQQAWLLLSVLSGWSFFSGLVGFISLVI